MKKIDGRSKEARAKKARSDALFAKRSEKAWNDAAAANRAKNEAAVAAQYVANEQQHADGSFTAQTGRTYKAIYFDAPASALDTQVDGDHYKKLSIQPMVYSFRNRLDPAQHTAIKYITRFRDKGGRADLIKAKHVIDMLIELEYGV